MAKRDGNDYSGSETAILDYREEETGFTGSKELSDSATAAAKIGLSYLSGEKDLEPTPMEEFKALTNMVHSYEETGIEMDDNALAAAEALAERLDKNQEWLNADVARDYGYLLMQAAVSDKVDEETGNYLWMATDEMLEGQPDDRRLLIHGPERVLERDALDAVHNNGYKLSYLQRWLEEDTITQGPDGPEINEGSTAMRYFDQVKEHNLNRTQKSEDGEPDVHNSRFLANEVASEALSELRFYGNGHTDTPHLERQLTLAILNDDRQAFAEAMQEVTSEWREQIMPQYQDGTMVMNYNVARSGNVQMPDWAPPDPRHGPR